MNRHEMERLNALTEENRNLKAENQRLRNKINSAIHSFEPDPFTQGLKNGPDYKAGLAVSEA